jgi:hypothetical protein
LWNLTSTVTISFIWIILNVLFLFACRQRACDENYSEFFITTLLTYNLCHTIQCSKMCCLSLYMPIPCPFALKIKYYTVVFHIHLRFNICFVHQTMALFLWKTLIISIIYTIPCPFALKIKYIVNFAFSFSIKIMLVLRQTRVKYENDVVVHRLNISYFSYQAIVIKKNSDDIRIMHPSFTKYLLRSVKLKRI